MVTMEDIDMNELDDYFLELRGERRSRATVRTPGSGRRRKTPQTPASRGRSRSRVTAARKLRLPSVTKSKSASRSRKMDIDTPLKKRVQYTQTRKVRHKNARTVLKKMPAGGKPYARRRKSMKKPKGAYRGAVMPRWAKGETKHILANDNCDITIASSVTGVGSVSDNGIVQRDATGVGEEPMSIGACHTWCLNPVKQGTGQSDRNGRSVDGTYLRIQGHIRNDSPSEKAYVRMVVLAVKGGVHNTASGGDVTRMGAPFVQSQLFKRIDGTVTGFVVPNGATGQGAAAVRTLQLPINKSLYTVLYDQKMQLADNQESFGSADRLFDAKIALKQRTQYGSAKADSFEKNQLVFCVMTVDPLCRSAAPVASTPTPLSTDLNDKIHLEFESKYSYKDF